MSKLTQNNVANYNRLFPSKPSLKHHYLTLAVLTLIIDNNHKQALVFYTNSRNLTNPF